MSKRTLSDGFNQLQMGFGTHPGFHLQLACAISTYLIAIFACCRLTSTRIADPVGVAIALLAVQAALIPLPIYWHEKRRPALRDAALTIPWAVLLTVTIPVSVDA